MVRRGDAVARRPRGPRPRRRRRSAGPVQIRRLVAQHRSAARGVGAQRVGSALLPRSCRFTIPFRIVVGLWLARRRRWFDLGAWFGAWAVADVLTGVLKIGVERPRPDLSDNLSFPSGHTKSASQIWVGLVLLLIPPWSRRWPAWIARAIATAQWGCRGTSSTSTGPPTSCPEPSSESARHCSLQRSARCTETSVRASFGSDSSRRSSVRLSSVFALAAITPVSPGYNISFDRKKQYSQSRLQIGPVGLANR